MIAYPIWQMKYCDKTVLLDTAKLNGEKTYLYFVADRNYPSLYSVDSRRVRTSCSLVYNGKIYCYSIPLEFLQNEGELPESLEKARQIEYEKFKRFKEKNKKR